MARAYGKLSALQIKRLSKRGMYNDGGGLYLQIAQGGSKSWLYRYKVGSKDRWHGLGPLHTISLAQARERAADARRVRLDGHDPIEAKRASRAAARLHAAKAISFETAAQAYIESHSNGWKNAKHAAQWTATLATYACPVFGSVPVAIVDTGLIMRALEPIWATKPETASRLRGRIESVLDWAKVRGYRTGENPARWKGHLDHLLAPRAKVRKVEHHAALPYSELGTFMVDLRQREAVAARALEFLILTVARSSETLNARWDEVDLANRMWTIPPDRMKASREHRVPLSDAAIAVLDLMKVHRQSEHIFPGQRWGRALSNMAMLVLLRRMGRGDLTAHGFRSSFRDWCAERTNVPSEVAEMALAHAVGSKVEAAYRRGDLLDKRRQLMDNWSEYCATTSVEERNVIPLRRGDYYAGKGVD
jgi:integrase